MTPKAENAEGTTVLEWDKLMQEIDRESHRMNVNLNSQQNLNLPEHEQWIPQECSPNDGTAYGAGADQIQLLSPPFYGERPSLAHPNTPEQSHLNGASFVDDLKAWMDGLQTEWVLYYSHP